MKEFTKFTSTVIPLAMKDVDTDMIIPAQYLTQINREGYGEHLFKNLKTIDPAFVFNQNKYHGSLIMLTYSNFGCGSSREHAVWALQQAGIRTIIAESFSDIFYNNAQKNGLLLVTLPKSDIAKLFAMDFPLQLSIDLDAQIIQTVNNETFYFNYDPFRKTCLLNGFDDLDYLLCSLETIAEYKKGNMVFRNI